MKFTITTLFLAVATSVDASSNLRFQKQKAMAVSKTTNYGKILDSEVVLEGTVGEPTAEDTEFIGKALVASYNDVHWEVDHFLTGTHAVDFRGAEGFLCRHCPDDDAMGAAATGVFDVRTPVGFLCRHCPDDDAMGVGDSILLAALTEDCAGLCKTNAAAELEVAFCNKIQSATGSTYLASTKSCAIRFDANNENGDNKAVPSVSTPVATLDSTLVLKGVGAGDATHEERAVLAKAFVSAYNDVHWDANHYLVDAEISMIAASNNNNDPDGFLCRHCPDDDSMGGRATSTMILDIVTPVEAFLCRHCPDDDAMGNSGFNVESLESSAFDKKALEVAFCRKIQNNPVSAKLASAKSCSVAVETIVL